MFDTQAAEDFITNAQRYAKIIGEKLPAGYSVDGLISHMKANVAICRQLMTENNNFIATYLKPVFAKPENLDFEDAVKLLDFTRRLHHPFYSKESERVKLDSFLAIDLYKALIKWATKTKDTEYSIKCWFGIGDIYYLLSGSLYSPDSVNAVKKAMELVEEAGGYFMLSEKNTRLCAAACYNKLAISTFNSIESGYPEKFLAIDNALAFYNRNDVRSFDPDFPWQTWIDDVNGNINYMGIHYEFMKSIGQIAPDLGERVYSFNRSYFTPQELAQLDSEDDTICSNFIQESININESDMWIHCIQYIIPSFHSGHIDLNRYIKMLRFCFDAHVSFLKTSPDFLTEYIRFDMMMVISAILAHYTKNQDIGIHLFNYLNELPREILDALPSSKDELRTVSENTLDTSMKQAYIEALLKSTTHNHLPTYVHSMMVSHLMTCFVSWFIENKPEKLVGMCGTKDTNEVHAKRETILDETRLAGLSHDIGKIAYIQAVSVISRSLTDNEFTLIRRHPDEGEYYLNKKEFGCIPDVVRGHQKTHDGEGGYPNEFDNEKSSYKFMIDICTASDCIDAATDDIGRSYQECKTGEMVIGEIIANSPSRYSPEIAHALGDQKLCASINDILVKVRPQCYYKAYKEFTEKEGRFR